MRELFYLKENLGILNYTKTYPTSFDEILISDGFHDVLCAYLNDVQSKHPALFNFLCPSQDIEEAARDITHLLKGLTIYQLDEIESMYLLNGELSKFQRFIEELYDFYRHLSRYSLITTKTANGLQFANFIEADTRFNQLVLSLYRTIEEKLQGKKNRIYRQLNAGTNACIVTREVPWITPSEYVQLAPIPFIDSLMLRTPLIMHTKCNKRYGSFTEVFENPLDNVKIDYQEWFCFPAKIGELTAFIYFHRDFISSGVSLGNLFEMATVEEYQDKKPDLICLFGVEDGKADTTFYFDEENDIYVGYLSHDVKIEYFGYMKKIALTLHNLEMMRRGSLPIHGSMVNITLKNGKQRGVMFIGDSGAGKSETIEALRMVGDDYIAKMDVIFDDMGSITLTDDSLYAQGTETGAFVRLDDLEKGTAYRDMDRSIFMNPENNNARVIIPATSYEDVIGKHKVDMIMYANNYTDGYGLHRFEDATQAKQTFVEGRRCALGTTHESGITTTYFANPFGPMQKQEICDELLDRTFARLYENDIFVGEIYTRLGIREESKDGIKEAATALLEYLNK